MTFVRLFRAYLRVSVNIELQYRANLGWQLVSTLTTLAFELSVLGIVCMHAPSLGGWRPPELLALVGAWTLVSGVVYASLWLSLHIFLGSVQNGTFDFLLLKPWDAQLLACIQRISVWRLVDVAVGMALLGVAVSRWPSEIGLSEVAGFAVMFVAGVVIVSSFLMCLACTAFWWLKVDNVMNIFDSLSGTMRWPVGIYPRWMRVLLTYVVPLAFGATVPIEALRGRLTGPAFGGALLFAVLMVALSRVIWRLGLRRYSGASA